MLLCRLCFFFLFFFIVFFFQAEDGIRYLVRSRGLGMCIRDSVLGDGGHRDAVGHLLEGQGKRRPAALG